VQRVFEHCALNHDVVLSDFILNELHDKLTGKFKFVAREAKAVVRLVMSRARVVPISPLDASMCRDPDDDAIIATAIAGQCRCIITGDKELLDLKTVNRIHVISPGAFWEFELTGGEQ